MFLDLIWCHSLPDYPVDSEVAEWLGGTMVVCPNCEAIIVPRNKAKKKKDDPIYTGLCYRCQHKIDEQEAKDKNREEKM